MICKLNKVLLNLKINSDRMRQNIDLTRGLVFSQRVLLALTEKMPSREEAYKVVQSLAMTSWEDQSDFKKLVNGSAAVKKYLKPKEIDSLFDISYYTKRAKEIIKRAIGK
jgi:adenylosuccinate lyase